MTRKVSTSSSPGAMWQDRFRVPSIAALRAGLPARARHAFDNLLGSLREIVGRGETLAWHGECWRWTIEIHAAGHIANGANHRNGHAARHALLEREPLAVIVPNPADLQLAMPVSREFANSLPLARMKRAVRDGLELAQEPFDSHWGVWSITSVGLIDDLQDLVELKLRHLARKAI